MSPKHARGDGTTIQRDGQWWAVVPLPAVDGKRRRWWQKAQPNTETGAEQTRRRMLREVSTRPAPSTRQRLGAYLADWLARREHLRPNTVRWERRAVAQMAPLAHVWLDALTPVQVQRWVDDLATRYAPTTVAGRLTVLRMALGVAVDLELIARNPATRVRPPRIPHSERPILSAAQARALLANVEDTPYLPVFAVAVAIGLRLGEALGLAWSDVDLDGARLTVRRQPMRQLDGSWDTEAPPKTPAGTRSIALPSAIVAALHRHRDRQRLLGHTCGLVCTSRQGRRLHAGTVAAVWLRERERIGAPAGMTFHDLRHSAASLLAAQGVHPSTVQAILGHTTMAQTGHYTHAAPESISEAAAAMDRLLEADGC